MFNTNEMVAVSKKIRQSAYLMLKNGPESAAACAAFVVCYCPRALLFS